MTTLAPTTSGTWRNAIDVHHHIVPPFYVDALADLGIPLFLPGVDRPSWSVDTSLEMMDRQGIRAAVISIWPGVPPRMEPIAAAGFARRINEFLAEFVAARSGRFGAFAVLPFPHVELMLAEFDYAMDVLGLDGVGVITNYGGTYLADRSFDDFLAEAARRRTPLFVHPTVPPSGGQPTFGLPASLYEFPFDTVRLTAQLLYERTLERFPDLRIILSHGGGGIAYYAGRILAGPMMSAGLGERLGTDPMAELGRLYFDVAMAGDRHALASIRSFAEPSQLLVGTDFPLMPEAFGERNARSVIEHGRFDTTEVAQLNHANAEMLFPRFYRHER